MMAKILVVDDEADLEVLIKQKFRQKIRENRYEFLFAYNGVQALEKLHENTDVDVVLSDINMPEMDGLTLLSKLAEENLLLKSVVVSAYGDMENIRTAMNRGAFDFITKPVNFQDLDVTIEKTIQHVEQMRQTLQAIRENNILRMYVDEGVLKFMGSKEYETAVMQSETIDGTVVFVDICGFTRISETEPAEQVVALLNSYFDVIVEEIISHGGHVDKFMGDAVMAVFRGDFHLDRAVETSLAVRSQIRKLPSELAFRPEVSIGINTGEMISGNIGSASLRRLDFTVIGDVVNTAQRLQSLAQQGQIFISEHAYNLIKESFKFEFVGEFQLRNKTKPVRAYQVLE
jgi:class 3 adenylate cyclase